MDELRINLEKPQRGHTVTTTRVSDGAIIAGVLLGDKTSEGHAIVVNHDGGHGVFPDSMQICQSGGV